MKINLINLANGYKTLLLEEIFPNDLLEQIHILCEQSENNDSSWEYPNWTKLRKIHNGIGHICDNIKDFLSSQQFVAPIENVINQKMIFVEYVLWADYPGFGPLWPHKEKHGQGQGQIFITRKEYPTNGTSICNDNGQLLFTMPYRNNFGWYFDQCTQVMHSRDYDVPDNIVRYSLIFWHNYK